MIGAHFAAWKARVEEEPNLTGHVHAAALVRDDGKPVFGTYVILWPTGPEDLDDNRLAKNQDIASDATFPLEGRAVGVDADTAMAAADAVMSLAIGHRLTVEGRRCDPLRLDYCDRIDFDYTVSPPLAYVDFRFILVSRRG